MCIRIAVVCRCELVMAGDGGIVETPLQPEGDFLSKQIADQEYRKS